jgi:cephalosporin hydroxylase
MSNEMSALDSIFVHLVTLPSDINEHLPTLKKYTQQCETVLELGVRYIVSSYAFLAGRPKKMVSVDIEHPSKYGGNLDNVIGICAEEGIDYTFIQANDLEIELEDTFDLLFIDTDHTYRQLTAELNKFSSKINKFIIMHDTSLFAENRIYEGRLYGGMKDAVLDFVKANSEWRIKEVFENNNGLTVLERCP